MLWCSKIIVIFYLIMINKKTKTENFILTKQNIHDLKSELENLIHFKRKEIIEDLKQARQQGDLSENSQYDAAKQKQVEIEERIAEINSFLKNHAITSFEKKGVVLIGKTVTLLDLKSNEKIVFKIGTVFDINISKNVISNISPLAKSIIGRKIGDRILIKGKNVVASY